MATTLQIIQNEIAAISDNGNNTAAELRKVLTDIVDFSNNGFEITHDAVVSTDTQMYQYSFKGTKKQCCNLYLLLVNKVNNNPSTGTTAADGSMFSFELQQAEYEILKAFVPDIDEDRLYMTYNLPTFRVDIRVFAVVALRKLVTSNTTKYFFMMSTDLGSEQAVITTIPLNYKKTVLPANKKDETAFKKIFDTMLKKTNFK